MVDTSLTDLSAKLDKLLEHMALSTYRDGANEITWVYNLGNTRSEFVRFLLV